MNGHCRDNDTGCGLILLSFGGRDGKKPKSTAGTQALIAEGFRYMGRPSGDLLKVMRTPAGKPVLKDDDSFWFNFSDSDAQCAAVFAHCPVGIDLEKTDRRAQVLIRHLPPEEQNYLSDAADEADGQTRLMRIWTAKEAFCKMTGRGLTKEVIGMSFVSAAAFDPVRIDPGKAGGHFEAEPLRPVLCPALSCRVLQLEVQEYILTVCSRDECIFDIAFLPPVR